VWSGKGVGVLAFGASRRSIHRVAEKGNSANFALLGPNECTSLGRHEAVAKSIMVA
jgi:hypothetical protein